MLFLLVVSIEPTNDFTDNHINWISIGIMPWVLLNNSELIFVTYKVNVFIFTLYYYFANGLGDLGSIPGRVIPETLKMVLVTSLLSIISCVSRVKRSNPGKGVVPSPTPRCSSYWKGSLLVALDYGRQLYWAVLLYRFFFLLLILQLILFILFYLL